MDNKVLNSFFSKKCFSAFMRGDDYFCGDYFVDDDFKLDVKTYNRLFDDLKKHYRNEYFYKTLLFNKLIVSKNKLETTKVMTELNVCGSVADFVTINGKIVIYEIKTEFDNLKRLKNQIDDYYKITPYVNVVISEDHLKEVIDKYNNDSFGIYVLTKKGSLKLIRECSAFYDCFDNKSIFNILRKKEYEELLLMYYKNLPKCSSFLYYSKCKELFDKIDKKGLYNSFVKILKKRISVNKEQVLKCPYSLRLMLYPSYNQIQFNTVFG